MSTDTLGATGFESTNLEEIKEQSKKNTGSELKGTTLGGTTLSPEPVLEAKKPRQKAENIEQSVENAENEFTQLFNTVKNYKEGEIITGFVSKIVNGVVYVDIAYKAEGIIEPEEISAQQFVKAADVCKIGDKLSVMILRLENKAGNPVLSKRRADYQLAWDHLAKAQKHNEDIQVTVHSKKSDGINVHFEGVQAFIPNSQISKEDLNRLDTLIGKTIYAKVVKVVRARKKVILSQKGSREKSKLQLKEAMSKIHSGDVLKGKVSSIKSFGAFVNIGEFDGLVHISELSWSRVEKVEDVLALDQEVEVYVLGIDTETARISLSMKKLQPDPWSADDLKVGNKVKVKITRFAQFGAFAEIKPGVEGLLHLTELSDEKQVKHPNEVIQEGQEVEATIIKIDLKTKKIGLSLRANPTLATEPAAAVTETA